MRKKEKKIEEENSQCLELKRLIGIEEHIFSNKRRGAFTFISTIIGAIAAAQKFIVKIFWHTFGQLILQYIFETFRFAVRAMINNANRKFFQAI